MVLAQHRATIGGFAEALLDFTGYDEAQTKLDNIMGEMGTKEKNEEQILLRFAALFVPPFIDDFFNKSRVRLRDIIIII